MGRKDNSAAPLGLRFKAQTSKSEETTNGKGTTTVYWPHPRSEENSDIEQKHVSQSLKGTQTLNKVTLKYIKWCCLKVYSSSFIDLLMCNTEMFVCVQM